MTRPTADPASVAGSEASRLRRPWGVTLLMLMGVAQGALLILVGSLMVAARNETGVAGDLRTTPTGVAVIGVAVASLGVALAVLSVLLGRGSDRVRTVVTVVALVQVAGSVYTLGALRDVREAGVPGLAVATAILWFLHGSTTAREFFER